ncbi:MAG TPA: TIGR03032 family protein [Cyclobacteriaceae bacterium]|nr:TIGR03032 family protein [Cyclobacteriaceae bacterium]
MNTTLQPDAPFSCNYSPQIPELLLKLNCSIVISTYQAGKLVMISPKDENSLITLPRSFDKPMGFDVHDDKLILACKDEVIVFENSQDLATHYPNKMHTYDSLFLPRMTYYTGHVDMHDISFGNKGIWAVNTSFSCVCLINGNHNFIPKWKPKFISELVSEDRCHLNGLVMQDGNPLYVTALGTSDTPQGWRDSIMEGGVLIDLSTDENIFEGLPMPHSPIFYKGELYVLLSATGQLVRLDVKNKKIEVIQDLEGFCRGLDIIGDYAFIGMSKLRETSSTFAKLAFTETADKAGIKIVHIPTKAMVGEIEYKTSVDEIYEVKTLQESIRPNILNTINPIHKYSLSIPGKTFWGNPNDKTFSNR